MNNEPTIQRVDIPQTVTVRKYPVNIDLLRECLRTHKIASGLTNKEIASQLYVPITKVEHWFRQDECFSIPDPELWFSLKFLLNINTNEFDKSIMTFEEKEGVYEKSERHYYEGGIMPTLTSTTAGNEKILVHDEPFIVASRGRKSHDEEKYTQNFEPNNEGVTNTLTTTLKDNYVVEPQLKVAEVVGGVGEKKSNGGTQYYQQDRIYQGDIALAHPASIPGGSYRYVVEEPTRLRIRKLTPKECFRLMGFDDEAFAKAETTCSNTQLYKQAGNSIVVDVLEHLFMNLKTYLYT